MRPSIPEGLDGISAPVPWSEAAAMSSGLTRVFTRIMAPRTPIVAEHALLLPASIPPAVGIRSGRV
jgi:hypothetical protein